MKMPSPPISMGEEERPQTFAELGVPGPLVRVLAADGKKTAFPIQADTLPDSLAGRDILGRGRTGSGKTLAFSIPLVARLGEVDADEYENMSQFRHEVEQVRKGHAEERRADDFLPHPRGLVLAPTRELANQINDVLTAMQADAGIPLTALKVDGGACANNYLLQTMADISNLPVKRPCCVETTALGAAYLAGLAVGYWSSTEDVLQNWSVDREFMPGIPDDERTRRLKGWNKAVRCSYGWAKEE